MTKRISSISYKNGHEDGEDKARKEMADMERNYSHQLGEIARLCYTVCKWAIGDGRPIVPLDVYLAADEIMDYVEAVRPADGPDVQWAMHIIGPDDVIPCVGEFAALRKANQHNKAFAKLMVDDPSPNDPYCVAVAELV